MYAHGSCAWALPLRWFSQAHLCNALCQHLGLKHETDRGQHNAPAEPREVGDRTVLASEGKAAYENRGTCPCGYVPRVAKCDALYSQHDLQNGRQATNPEVS